MSTWQPQHDFPGIVDSTEAVTFVAADETATEIIAALRRRVTARDIEQSQGRFTQADTFWHLPQSELSTTPQPGEQIVDAADQAWVILAVNQDVHDGRWRCACRLSALNPALPEPVDWLQATWSKNDHGAQDAAWSAVLEDISASVMSGEAEQVIVRGVHALRQTSTVSLAAELALAIGDRFQRQSGDMLDIMSFTPPEENGGVFIVQTVPVNNS